MQVIGLIFFACFIFVIIDLEFNSHQSESKMMMKKRNALIKNVVFLFGFYIRKD